MTGPVFLDPPDCYQRETSLFKIIPCPYEGNTTYGDGARSGPEAITQASQHLEYYDVETRTEPYQHGIYTQASQTPHESIRTVAGTIDHGKTFPVFIGGDHSITLPITEALPADVDVLILDAHADMRYKWKGSTENHACVTRHISANRNAAVLGVRSMDKDEHQAANESENVDLVRPRNVDDYTSDRLNDSIHISIDVDVFDPKVITQTGTPEPNGLRYDGIHTTLKDAFTKHDVVSVDIVEFAPSDEEPAQKRAEAYTIAKLIYTILGMTTKTQKHRLQLKDHGQ